MGLTSAITHAVAFTHHNSII